MPYRHPTLMLLAFALAGCVTVPDSLQGEYAEAPLPDAVTQDHRDQQVRWGGLLVATPRVGDEENCMEIFALPLDAWHRPDLRSPTAGRFLACHDGPLDPEEFAPGRDLTLVGTFEGFVEGQVGDEIHRFPLVNVGAAHVWPLPAQFQNGPPRQQDGGQSQQSRAAIHERIERSRALRRTDR